MSEVSITEAAKLTGKSEKTIYRHISQGKTSATASNDGKKLVSISELERVYGRLKKINEKSETKSMSEVESLKIAKEIRLLREQVNDMNGKIDILLTTRKQVQIETAEKQGFLGRYFKGW